MEFAAENYREAIVSIATDLINAPAVQYTAGHPELGQSPELGFDCSGFVRYVLLRAGLHIPSFIGLDDAVRPIRHASEFFDHYGIAVHDGLQQPGDLIFFSLKGIYPVHMGIVKDSTSYIHAPTVNGGTKVEAAPIKYEDIPILPDRRQIFTRSPIGFKAPSVALENPTYRQHQKII